MELPMIKVVKEDKLNKIRDELNKGGFLGYYLIEILGEDNRFESGFILVNKDSIVGAYLEKDEKKAYKEKALKLLLSKKDGYFAKVEISPEQEYLIKSILPECIVNIKLKELPKILTKVK